jgi:hypothetical protein
MFQFNEYDFMIGGINGEYLFGKIGYIIVFMD